MAPKKTPTIAEVVEELIDDPIWDSEEKHELGEGPVGSIYNNTLHCSVSLWAWMVREWGGVVTAIKTSSNPNTGEVTVGKAEATDAEPVTITVRLSETMNAAEFSLWRPLRKLNLKVPDNRRLQVMPTMRKTKSGRIVFIFPLNQAKSLPRTSRTESSQPVPQESEE
jgi:hypothetical protein